jgi:hypothetical protein
LEAGTRAGAAVGDWSHVRLFSAWSEVTDVGRTRSEPTATPRSARHAYGPRAVALYRPSFAALTRWGGSRRVRALTTLKAQVVARWNDWR